MARKTWQNISDIYNYPMPAATQSYAPVHQGELFTQVKDAFYSEGYRIGTESHQVHHVQPVFISKVDIEAELGGPSLPENTRMNWSVAVINSYNKTKAVRLVFGGTVFACLNGMIVADHILRTKHTTNVWDRLPDLIGKAVSAFGNQIDRAGEFYSNLRNQHTDPDRLAAFAVRLAQEDILPKAKVMDFFDEAANPSFMYETDKWCLYNVHAAYTHLAKEFNPIIRPNRVLKFERALTETYSLT